MSRPLLAWSLAALGAVLILGYLPFLYVGRDAPVNTTFGAVATDALAAVAFLAFPLVGGLIASRQPRSPIGWIFVAMGVFVGAIELSRGYAVYALYVSDPPAPGGVWVAWLQQWTYVPGILLLGLLLLLFPTGRLPSPRWRWLFPIAIAGGILEAGSSALRPGTNPDFPGTVNPFGVGGEWLPVTLAIGSFLDLAFIVGGAAAAVVRMRRSRGVERQQMKWFGYAAAFNIIVLPLSTVTYGQERTGLLAVLALLPALSVVAIPIGAGIAILRYRLYDIDILINRTLVYASLSACIAATYVVLVVLLQAALRPVTGGSEIAVAGSTLATLALVQPLRRRIQDAVDQRFYRSRYDAARALDALTTRLRDDVDLLSVQREVLGVVGETVQPAHASVWLRGPAR